MRTLEGKMIAKGIRIGIVVSRFNEFITSKLLGGAMDGLLRHDVSEDNVDVAWVPGAFDIRGGTTHYDYVCNEVSKGIASVSLQTGIPVMFGIVTTENIEQAIERAGTKAGNKGYDCALGAIEMINLIKTMEQ